jgi:hypothetical protein
VLLGNKFRGRWYTIDPTRTGNGIIKPDDPVWEHNTTGFRKADKVDLKYGGCQTRLYVIRSDRKNHESNLEILYVEESGRMADILYDRMKWGLCSPPYYDEVKCC